MNEMYHRIMNESADVHVLYRRIMNESADMYVLYRRIMNEPADLHVLYRRIMNESADLLCGDLQICFEASICPMKLNKRKFCAHVTLTKAVV